MSELPLTPLCDNDVIKSNDGVIPSFEELMQKRDNEKGLSHSYSDYEGYEEYPSSTIYYIHTTVETKLLLRQISLQDMETWVVRFGRTIWIIEIILIKIWSQR